MLAEDIFNEVMFPFVSQLRKREALLLRCHGDGSWASTIKLQGEQ